MGVAVGVAVGVVLKWVMGLQNIYVANNWDHHGMTVLIIIIPDSL